MDKLIEIYKNRPIYQNEKWEYYINSLIKDKDLDKCKEFLNVMIEKDGVC